MKFSTKERQYFSKRIKAFELDLFQEEGGDQVPTKKFLDKCEGQYKIWNIDTILLKIEFNEIFRK